MTDTLQKLFGGAAKLKLLKLFLFNTKTAYTIQEAAERAQVKVADARKEIVVFQQIGLIKKAHKTTPKGVSKKIKKAPKGMYFQLAPDFEYTLALQNLLLNTAERENDIYDRMRATGSIKFIVIAGVLLGEWEDSRLDLFVVGEKIDNKKLRDQARKLESELGKELRYAALSTEEFYYRMNMNDHLIKDVFDFPHKIVHDKLNIGLK